MTEPFPPKIGAPATRALATAGITSFAALAKWTEPDLLALHGMGPKAAGILGAALAAQGRSFRSADTTTAKVGDVEAYLATVAPPQRASLDALRQTLRSILPHADEAMKYGMPAFLLHGKGVAGYAAFTDHNSYFPMSSEVIGAARHALDRYPTSKGGIRFGIDERLPTTLVRRLVKLRLAEIASVQDGRRSEYYPDGQLKAVGPMKDGRLHGKWKWFRRDGSLMRTGQFSHGDRVGTWTTFDDAGQAVKTTRF